MGGAVPDHAAETGGHPAARRDQRDGRLRGRRQHGRVHRGRPHPRRQHRHPGDGGRAARARRRGGGLRRDPRRGRHRLLRARRPVPDLHRRGRRLCAQRGPGRRDARVGPPPRRGRAHGALVGGGAGAARPAGDRHHPGRHHRRPRRRRARTPRHPLRRALRALAHRTGGPLVHVRRRRGRRPRPAGPPGRPPGRADDRPSPGPAGGHAPGRGTGARRPLSGPDPSACWTGSRTAAPDVGGSGVADRRRASGHAVTDARTRVRRAVPGANTEEHR
ncbi:hypothetical protein SGPA1_20374 [Streptomyces misionensis JCM 4497]